MYCYQFQDLSNLCLVYQTYFFNLQKLDQVQDNIVNFICGSNRGTGGYCKELGSAASGRRLEGSALPKLTWPEGTVAERLSGLERDLRAIKDHLGVTHSPTSSPTSNTSTASYDSVLKAPKCGVVHSTGICTTYTT